MPRDGIPSSGDLWSLNRGLYFLPELHFLMCFILFQSLKSQNKTLKLRRVQIPLMHPKKHQNKVWVGDLHALLQYPSRSKLPADAYRRQFDTGNTYSFTCPIQPPLYRLFPTNPTLSPCDCAWRASDNSEKRGHPLGLISAGTLGELGHHELQKPALWLSAISYAGHVPCKPSEGTVREMGTLPAGALGTASPRETSPYVQG